MKERKGRAYTRDEIFPLILFDDFVDGRRVRIRQDLDGDLVKVNNSLRLQTFVRKGTVCAACGIEGTRFYKERSDPKSPYHLNLYAVAPDGSEVLMTKDHIVPQAKGGLGSFDNLQPMCAPCNEAKKGGV
jgi:5-methylcytosine-specific restriction endonuclease McrA